MGLPARCRTTMTSLPRTDRRFGFCSRRPGGSMAQFRLPAGQVSRAVRHRTVEEIWYILSGAGEMWRGAGEEQSFASLSAGVCLTIPVGVSFQFRSTGPEPLQAIAVTMPPWPGPEEAEPAQRPLEGNDRMALDLRPTANSATRTCRPRQPTRASAPMNARSAPRASRPICATFVRTAAAGSRHARSGRRTNGGRGFPARSNHPATKRVALKYTTDDIAAFSARISGIQPAER